MGFAERSGCCDHRREFGRSVRQFPAGRGRKRTECSCEGTQSLIELIALIEQDSASLLGEPRATIRDPFEEAVVTTLDEIGDLAKLTPEFCTFFSAVSENEPLAGRHGLPRQHPLLIAKVKALQARFIGIDVAEKYETCRRGNEGEKPDPRRVTAQPAAHLVARHMALLFAAPSRGQTLGPGGWCRGPRQGLTP